MDLNSTKLPYIIFKIIRQYVGERHPELKRCLKSHVYDKMDLLFRNIYGIPSFDPDGEMSWTIMPLVINQPNEQHIVALGNFEYVRTIPIMNDYNVFERRTFVFKAPSQIFWTFIQFMEYVTSCESELRTDYNSYLGHMFCDGLDIEVINGISRVYPYIH